LEHPKAVLSLAPFASVFGRLTPHDKVSVIKTYVDLGFVTLMAGDGGNDVGALKAAHVGVALSDAEASIVAPFTSLDKTITAVVDVLKEGRCALASAIATYKYMIMYGQVETIIQLISAYFQITPSEFCWVFMDGIWSVLWLSAFRLVSLTPFLLFFLQDDHDGLFIASVVSGCRVGDVASDDFNPQPPYIVERSWSVGDQLHFYSD
jgi:magnesium-transporting ATPase (P-type)